MRTFRVIEGDVASEATNLDAESFDAVLCDPPYGLNFMGKAWDHGVPSADVWSAVSRALKPGGHLIAFGGTRTFHRLACAIEDAGFEIRDCLCWLYGQGFPKSHNLSGTFRGYGTALKPAWEPAILAMKPTVGTFLANSIAHGVAGLNVEGCRIGGFNAKPDVSDWDSSQGSSRGQVEDFDRDGAGSMSSLQERMDSDGKPLRNMVRPSRAGEPSAARRYYRRGSTDLAATPGHRGGDPAGRWPTNVCLDEFAAALLDQQSGDLGRSAGTRVSGNASPNGIFGAREKIPTGAIGFGDSGGASRFFYVAKASRGEREAGLDGFERRVADPMAQHAARRQDDDGERWAESQGRGLVRARNHHPTVKPIALAEWLAKLLLPPARDTPRRLLVPFSGSGSEMIGALRVGWEYVVGVEIDPEYASIARARIRGDAPLLNVESAA